METASVHAAPLQPRQTRRAALHRPPPSTRTTPRTPRAAASRVPRPHPRCRRHLAAHPSRALTPPRAALLQHCTEKHYAPQEPRWPRATLTGSPGVPPLPAWRRRRRPRALRQAQPR